VYALVVRDTSNTLNDHDHAADQDRRNLFLMEQPEELARV